MRFHVIDVMKLTRKRYLHYVNEPTSLCNNLALSFYSPQETLLFLTVRIVLVANYSNHLETDYKFGK